MRRSEAENERAGRLRKLVEHNQAGVQHGWRLVHAARETSLRVWADVHLRSEVSFWFEGPAKELLDEAIVAMAHPGRKPARISRLGASKWLARNVHAQHESRSFADARERCWHPEARRLVQQG
jgi:hypothetical protein